jgi:hypothetical protein
VLGLPREPRPVEDAKTPKKPKEDAR